jgi:hypothetical protein
MKVMNRSRGNGRINVKAMGRAGLTGIRGKVAERVARPLSQRTRFTEEQIEAILGGVLLVAAFVQFFRTMRRVWEAKDQPA